MSNEVFPKLPGIKWGSTRTPIWSTKVQTSASGREIRGGYWSYPRWKYSLSYDVLRANALKELQTLVGFFNARQGQLDTFLYDDPDDNTAVDEPFGVVVAGRTKYQLARNYGGWVEPVLAPKPAAIVKANGRTLAAGTEYQIDANGTVTLLGGVSAGQKLTWTGGFYWRVRFTHDSADFEQFMRQLWTVKRVEFMTVKI